MKASWLNVSASASSLCLTTNMQPLLTRFARPGCSGLGGRGNPRYTLDRVPFFFIPTTRIPPGYCEVDVDVNDNGVEIKCMMVAGHVAYSASSTAGDERMDTVRPSAEWFMFEKK